MKTLILTATLLPLLTSVAAQSGSSYAGCYKSSGSLIRQETEPLNSPSACRETCMGAGNFTVEAMTKGTECYCGTSLPPASDKAEDSRCEASCPGAASETCGSGAGDFFSVYLTGTSSSPPVGNNNSTVTTASARNSTSTTTTDGSSGTSTSIPTDTNKPTVTTTTGSATRAGGASTTSSTGKPNSGDSVQFGGGMLVGAIIGVLAMVF